MTEPNRETQALSAAIEMFADLDSAVNLMTYYSDRHKAITARLEEMTDSYEGSHVEDCPWLDGLGCSCRLGDVRMWIDYLKGAL